MWAIVNPVVLWLILCLILLVIETITLNLYTVSLAAGALFGMAAAVLGLGLYWQLAFFVAVGGLLMLFIRPVSKRIAKGEAENAEAEIGKLGVVVSQIDNVKKTGEIKLDGKRWSARAIDEMTIEKDADILVIAVSGNKLMVRRK